MVTVIAKVTGQHVVQVAEMDLVGRADRAVLASQAALENLVVQVVQTLANLARVERQRVKLKIIIAAGKTTAANG